MLWVARRFARSKLAEVSAQTLAIRRRTTLTLDPNALLEFRSQSKLAAPASVYSGQKGLTRWRFVLVFKKLLPPCSAWLAEEIAQSFPNGPLQYGHLGEVAVLEQHE